MTETDRRLPAVLWEAEAFTNRTQHPEQERRLQVSAEWSWSFVGLACVLQTNVRYTGDSGICDAIDWDIQLLWLAVNIRLVRRVRPYGRGEGVLDALLRVESEESDKSAPLEKGE